MRKNTRREFDFFGRTAYVSYSVDHGYIIGGWNCPICGQSGESSKACDMLQDLIDLARGDLIGHYGQMHPTEKLRQDGV